MFKELKKYMAIGLFLLTGAPLIAQNRNLSDFDGTFEFKRCNESLGEASDLNISVFTKKKKTRIVVKKDQQGAPSSTYVLGTHVKVIEGHTITQTNTFNAEKGMLVFQSRDQTNVSENHTTLIYQLDSIEGELNLIVGEANAWGYTTNKDGQLEYYEEEKMKPILPCYYQKR